MHKRAGGLTPPPSLLRAQRRHGRRLGRRIHALKVGVLRHLQRIRFKCVVRGERRIGTGLEQQPDNVRLRTLGSDHQCREPGVAAASQVHIGLACQEGLHQWHLAHLRGDHE